MPIPSRDEIHPLIMTRYEYSEVESARPYTYTIENDTQQLIYFWGNHSFDLQHPQNLEIQQLRESFLHHPNPKKHALIEARVLAVAPSKTEAIETQGEVGLLARLATQSGVDRTGAEPTRQEQVTYLEQFFSREDIFYSNLGTCFATRHRWMTGKTREELCLACAKLFHTFPWREEEDLSLEKVKQIHTRLFGTPFDPMDAEHRKKLDNPTLHYSVTNDISRKSDDVRERSITGNIISKRQEGYDIFVVYGESHAIIEEKALREFCR